MLWSDRVDDDSRVPAMDAAQVASAGSAAPAHPDGRRGGRRPRATGAAGLTHLPSAPALAAHDASTTAGDARPPRRPADSRHLDHNGALASRATLRAAREHLRALRANGRGDLQGAGGSRQADVPGLPGSPGAARGTLLDRRRLLSLAGLTAAAVPLGSSLAACSGGGSSSGGVRPVRIGFVTPQTGSLSDFSDPDDYVVEAMRKQLSSGITVGRSTHPVDIIVRDSQSDRNQAATVATQLIFDNNVDIILVGGTAETANPVADQCEAYEVPCISTLSPWEVWFDGRGGTTEAPFNWTYHVYWGGADVARIHRAMWDQVQTNKRVGVVWPNNIEGELYNRAFPGEVGAGGYTYLPVASPNSRPLDNLYQPGQFDAAGYVQRFVENDIDIVTGLLSPADFKAFWIEAGVKNFNPQVVTVSGALLFPDDVRGLGADGANLATEVSWSPNHPYKSSLTGMSATELAADYLRKTGKSWVQSLGYAHALFEIAVAALADVASLDDRRAIAHSIAAVKQDTIVGKIGFGARADVPKNVAHTVLVGGQWRRRDNDFELHVVTNDGAARIQMQSGMIGLRDAAGA